jgi:hypothetical protein
MVWRSISLDLHLKLSVNIIVTLFVEPKQVACGRTIFNDRNPQVT